MFCIYLFFLCYLNGNEWRCLFFIDFKIPLDIQDLLSCFCLALDTF